MAVAPIPQLTKAEILKLYLGRCRHGHRYIEHYNCFQEEHPEERKIGFFDIECSNLKADFGIIFCYCIKELGTDRIVERTITREELDNDLDKSLLKQMIEDFKQFDTLITYYGTKFDIPYVRTRALYWGLDFPEFGAVFHKDVYYMVKHKLKLSRSSLQNACQVILGKSDKTHWMSDHWLLALRGNEKSLAYILDHCQKDVKDLEKLYNKMMKYARPGKRSI